MATHSSVLAWEIPWTEEPGRLKSMSWQKIGHNRAHTCFWKYISIYKKFMFFFPFKTTSTILGLNRDQSQLEDPRNTTITPSLFNVYAEYIVWNAGLDEAQSGIKTARKNINHLRYADDTTLMAETEEELKSLLMEVKEESKKVGLKLKIQKTKIMATGCITSWQIDGETMKTVRDFIFLGSKITADGDSSHEIKRRLLLGRKAVTNLDNILKSRHYLADKSLSSQSYDFSSSHVWMQKLDHKESSALKNWCFELWCWRRLLRIPWTARRSKQSILKEINPEYSSEGLMLKLKLQYSGHLMWRTNSLEKDPDDRKDWRQEDNGMSEDEMVGWHYQLNGYEFEQALRVVDGQGRLACYRPWGLKESDMTEWLNWRNI